MTTSKLLILQLNIGKSRACMEALINDSNTNQIDILHLLSLHPAGRGYVQPQTARNYSPLWTQ
jgi:hypothetical protein